MESSRARQRTLFSTFALVVAAILFVAVVVVANASLRSARVDLTQQKLFTLSPASRNVLQKIDEPITVRFYFSERLGREIPSIGLYAARVRDLLEEYASRSKGKLRLEISSPEPFSEAEDRAVAAGLQGVPVDQGGELVYFGLVATNSTDDREVIPFFEQSRESLLEYDITRIISTLATTEKPTVGVLSSLPLGGSPYARQAGGPDDSWMSYNQLKQSYQVETISGMADAIPEKIKLLILVHPKNLSDKMLYAVDQYVLRGGALLVFVDPHSEIDAATPRPGMPPGMGGDSGSNLAKLFAAWGIEMPADQVAGDLNAARRVQAPAEAGGSRVVAVDYPLWVTMTQQNLNQSDPVVSQLAQINMASPGFLRRKEDAAVTMEPLISTSARGSGTVPATELQGQVNPVKVVGAFRPTDEPLVLAARLQGKVKSAFPEGAPKAEDAPKAEGAPAADPAKPEPAAHISEASQSINVMVVADVDILADAMWVRVQDFFGQRIAMPFAHNGPFFLNAVENLSGSSDLIALRSRGVYQRPFTEVQEIQRAAERRFRAKEQELMASLKDTEQKLAKVQGKDSAEGNIVLTTEQKDAIEQFRQDTVRIRRELRDVQHALRQDVENLSNWIKAINIGLIPILVAIIAVAVAIMRRSYRQRPRAA